MEKQEVRIILLNLLTDHNYKYKLFKIGGKTSLVLSLFNAIKPLTGKVSIDNVDITKIGIQHLRKSLSIFTQEAALFTGSTFKFLIDT